MISELQMDECVFRNGYPDMLQAEFGRILVTFWKTPNFHFVPFWGCVCNDCRVAVDRK